jgi:Nucleotidyltransferase domain
MHSIDPTAAALELVAAQFPDAIVTFLAGSVMRGEATETSDLDLVVVYERLEAAYRESFVHAGWPVEAFVHDTETLRYFFLKEDRDAGVPSLADMVASGVPLPKESALSKSLQVLAAEVILRGPPRWNDAEVAASRYAITNLVDDLRSPRSLAELTATATALYSALAEHFLRAQGLWSAKGKSIPRRLEFVAPVFAQRFADVFADLFARSRTEAVIQLCEDVLSPYGGWLFAGYKAVAPADWKLSGAVPAQNGASEQTRDK